MKSFDCDLYMDLMPLVRDGAASDASREAVEEHLKGCPGCREIYKTLPETTVDEDGNALKKIRRRLWLTAWAVVLCASVVGACLSQTSRMGYNLILFPVVGIIAYCAMGAGAWRAAPGVAAFCAVISALRAVPEGESVGAAALYSLCYGAMYLLGVGLGWLMHRALANTGEKPRWKHTSMGLLALASCAALLYGIDRFAGNPISRAAVQIHSRQYLQEEYPDLKLEMGEIYYDWYSGGHYEIDVTSPVSPDTVFILCYDRLGRLTLDSYDSYVASGISTLNRLETANQELMRGMKEMLEEELGITVNFSLASDWASVYDGVIDYPFWPEHRIIVSELIVDGEYDGWAMTEWYGVADFSGEGEVSEEAICRILRELQELVEWSGVGVDTVNVHLYNDRGEDIKIAGFSYWDIGTENMEQLIHEAVLAWEAFEIEYEKAIEEQNRDQ